MTTLTAVFIDEFSCSFFYREANRSQIRAFQSDKLLVHKEAHDYTGFRTVALLEDVLALQSKSLKPVPLT